MKKKKKAILVLHGPNLNNLGKRNKKLYGSLTLKAIETELKKIAKKNKYELISYQSNIEGQLVNKIQKCAVHIKGLLINPAAYSHTSVSIRDALEDIKIPVVEVHLSNIFAREPFRKHSLISEVVSGQIVGFGPESYLLGLKALIQLVEHGLSPVQ